VYEQIFSSKVISPFGSAPFQRASEPASIDQSPEARTVLAECKLLQGGQLTPVQGFIGFVLGPVVVGALVVVIVTGGGIVLPSWSVTGKVVVVVIGSKLKSVLS
jgi:hypothetical protein